MERNSKDIDISKEQERIANKIQKIQDSGVFDRIESVLSTFHGSFRNLGIRNSSIQGRIKKANSASDKIAKQGVSADEIYDLIGFMMIVDLPEEYKEAKEFMQGYMPQESFVHDFDGSLPENNGYSSFHMGVDVEKLLSSLF